jgi:hypothetical protein
MPELRMPLADFIAVVEGPLSGKIRSLGDEPRTFGRTTSSGPPASKLYAPITLRNSRERSQVTASVRVMGVECEGRHEVWLTVWSRAHGEVAALDRAAQSSEEWIFCGDREAGERLYRKAEGRVMLGFDESGGECDPKGPALAGSATLIYDETRDRPYSMLEYLAAVQSLIYEMQALVG